MMEITSSQNERVKLVRALQSRSRSRRKEGKLVLEGVRLLADALDCGARPDFVFYLPEQVAAGQPAHPLFEALWAQDVPLFAVPEAIMAEISDTETPQGVLGVLPLPQIAPPEVVELVLVLDGIKTPGNLGSTLRTAAAAGVDVVVLPPNTVDPFNPKVLRGGMGAHFRLPILQLDWPAINRQFGALPAYVAAADGDQPYYGVDWLAPALVIVGGEAHGPTSTAYAMALRSITIPMVSGTESLNAAVAAGVILYEIRRQRLLAAGKGA